MPSDDAQGTPDVQDGEGYTDDERWMVIGGRRWRRTDPALPEDLVAALTSHLGRARSAVRTSKKRADEAAVAAARRRVDLAKHGLGERGPSWWDTPEADRLAQARARLTDLDALDAAGGPDLANRSGESAPD